MHPADETPQALPLKRLRMNAGGGDPGEEAPLYIQSCTLRFIALLLGSRSFPMQNNTSLTQCYGNTNVLHR